MAIRMRYGLESEFDPDKMVVGEWAVSTDMKYVRMCFAPGIVARMATYESFEADMVKVQELVSNAQSVKNIVIGLASEVGSKTTIVLEATEEAKKYMEEAKKYSELAFATTPDGYEVLVRDVDLLKNAIVQTTDRTLYGSKAGGIKLIGIKGASEQAVYSGKNLLDTSALASTTVQGITYTPVYNNGLLEYVSASGTSTAVSIYNIPFTASANVEYVLSGSPSDGSWLTYLVDYGLGEYADTGSGKTFTLTEDTESYVRLRISDGVTVNDVRFYPMIRLATTEDSTYEPYTGNAPSPSPSYPQSIESVGDSGSLVIEQRGKNFFSGWIMGESVNPNMGGFYPNEKGARTDYIRVNSAETYTISGLLNAEFGFVAFYDIDKKFITRTGGNSSWGADKLNADRPNECVYIVVSVYENTAVSSFNIANISKEVQIELGETATPYEPYQGSNTITIPLNEPLRGIGDIKDEVVCKDGVWGVLRKIRSRAFDGSENWQASSTNTSGIHRRRYEGWTTNAPKGSTANTSIANVLCDSYIHNSANATYSRIQGVSIDTVGALDIYDENYNTNNLSSWRAWLTENPIEVEYELATPVFEPFTDQTPFYGMQSYDTVTYISTDSKVEPSIEVKYARTEGDAITLGNYNRTKLNEIRISELMALQTELATALVAGSEV